MTAEPVAEGTRRPFARRWGSAVAARSRQVPLRVRLVLLTCALVTGALISTGFAATDLLRNSLMNRVDSQLISASHELTDQVPRRLAGSRGPGVPGSTTPAAGGQPGGETPGGNTPVSCATTNTTDTTTDTRPRLPSPYYFQTSDNAGVPTSFSQIPLDQADCGPAVPSLDIAAVKARLGKPFT
ncbi:MAG TPA: hypothetical protein VK662_04060, partial [Acidothermaceae bacterium]|nr:hypothetical protein [Acidothermaceae bacterium]